MLRRLLLLLTVGLPLVVLGLAAPASAQTNPAITINSATIVAKGAGVSLNVTITCAYLDSAFVSFTLSQRSTNEIAQGEGAQTAQCTGSAQGLTFTVIADAGSRPFRAGDAIANGSLSDCTPDNTCQYVFVNQTVRIRK